MKRPPDDAMMRSTDPGPLFAPIVHTNDPTTSHEAAVNATRHFRRGHARLVLQAVADHPGWTACELAEVLGMGEYQVRRRLTDLKHDSHISQEPARACRVKGSRMVTWVVCKR